MYSYSYGGIFISYVQTDRSLLFRVRFDFTCLFFNHLVLILLSFRFLSQKGISILNRLFQKMDKGLCYTPGVVIMFGAGLVREL